MDYSKNKTRIVKLLIPVAIFAMIGLTIFYSAKNQNSKNKEQLVGVSGLSSQEISFLTNQGFLPTAQGEKNELTVANLKSPNLVEQNLNSPEESFEVLATKLNNNDKSYQMAFRLENKSGQNKEFYLIPVSKESQLQFEEIKGVVNNENAISISKGDIRKEPLEQLYDMEKHKKELKTELAKAYDDIKNNNYQPSPIKITLAAKSILLAQSNWKINGDPFSAGLEPVYFLVQGSAGGVKDDLIILDVHSSPQQGENWEVSFTTNGTADLTITPNDQATVDDDEFVSLSCNGEKRTPQILQGDIIYYPNWECPPSEVPLISGTKEGSGTGKVVHYTKRAGKHTLKFQFSDQIAYAYNNPVTVTFQQGVQPDASYVGCQDTGGLVSGLPNYNYGTSVNFLIQPTVRLALMSFDVSSIPSSASVDDAVLYIRSSALSGAGKIVAAYQGKVAWIEGTKDAATAGIGEPCWNYRQYNTVAWGAAGGACWHGL